MEKKELLKHARALYEFNQTPENVKSALEKEFPELKESVDERIRTRLIALVEAFGQGEYKNEMLAYLEKQKEQEPINQCNTHEPTLDEARKWNEAYEKGYSLGYENGRNEQKPAEWSEEDEKMLIGVIDTIKDAIAECDCDDVGARAMLIYEKELNWLENRFKSLHPQPQWKPSEGQMEALRRVVYRMGNSCFGKSWANDENLHSLYVALEKLMWHEIH